MGLTVQRAISRWHVSCTLLYREVVASAPYLHESNLNLVVADSPPLIHNPFVQIHDLGLWLSGQSPVTEWLGLD